MEALRGAQMGVLDRVNWHALGGAQLPLRNLQYRLERLAQ